MPSRPTPPWFGPLVKWVVMRVVRVVMVGGNEKVVALVAVVKGLDEDVDE